LEHKFINIKGGIDLEYKIRPEREHVIITDAQGKFICSCDNYKEAQEEIEEMEEIK
jgi:hypothetical protein